MRHVCAVDNPGVLLRQKRKKASLIHKIDLVGAVKTKAKLFTYYKGLYESLGANEKFKLGYKYLAATADMTGRRAAPSWRTAPPHVVRGAFCSLKQGGF